MCLRGLIKSEAWIIIIPTIYSLQLSWIDRQATLWQVLSNRTDEWSCGQITAFASASSTRSPPLKTSRTNCSTRTDSLLHLYKCIYRLIRSSCSCGIVCYATAIHQAIINATRTELYSTGDATTPQSSAVVVVVACRAAAIPLFFSYETFVCYNWTFLF